MHCFSAAGGLTSNHGLPTITTPAHSSRWVSCSLRGCGGRTSGQLQPMKRESSLRFATSRFPSQTGPCSMARGPKSGLEAKTRTVGQTIPAMNEGRSSFTSSWVKKWCAKTEHHAKSTLQPFLFYYHLWLLSECSSQPMRPFSKYLKKKMKLISSQLSRYEIVNFSNSHLEGGDGTC